MLISIFDSLGKKQRDNEAKTKEEILLNEIELAKKEWDYAQKRFNDVSDPEMVDYIVYYIIAAERRYMYLLNKYKVDIQETKKNLSDQQEL